MVMLLSAPDGSSTVFAQTSQPATPTFDCSKASGQVESLICKDGELIALDRRMAEIYARALRAWPANIAAEQRAYQRGWIGGRNECWKETDVRACTVLSYRTRMVELQITSGQLVAPPAVAFRCQGVENKPFTATFYRETDPSSAVLTYGDDQVIAFAAPSGSGAQYTAANVAFWDHQGEATVTWFGTKLVCRPAAAATTNAQRMALNGTAWQLVEFQSSDDTTLAPSGKDIYTLTFQDDGQLLIRSDCNRGQATWKSADQVSLSIGLVALTRAMCPDTPLQRRFVRDLDFVRSYVVRDGHLFLSLMADGGIYQFEPIPAK
jgi:uncharacterized protein